MLDGTTGYIRRGYDSLDEIPRNGNDDVLEVEYLPEKPDIKRVKGTGSTTINEWRFWLIVKSSLLTVFKVPEPLVIDMSADPVCVQLNQPRAHTDRPELFIPFKDNQHPWEKAYVGVFDHPFFAVSDQIGNYQIRGLPVGTYKLVAWHEKLGEQELEVTLGAGESRRIDFTFDVPVKPGSRME